MKTHAIRKHLSVTPEGKPADFILNGQPPKPRRSRIRRGLERQQPCVDLADPPPPRSIRAGRRATRPPTSRWTSCSTRRAGTIRSSASVAVGDVKPTFDGTRAPEPLFIRANSDQVVEFWLTNLVPTDYELDDFQVRTPTDVIGQHIHLVKFDVTSSDGAGNGYNYESAH